ncbi:hypothetical protein BKI52_34235 [marine bacterium AO1-C]|nr:hypothetical protein BKI52_34235 [marine bacterium AO1-C]
MNNHLVLLVDDDEITNFMSKQILGELGLNNVTSVKNGKEALKYVQNRCPDLIFLDIKMPVMDGFEFLAELQEKQACPHTKIIMLTSSSREAEKKQAAMFKNVVDFLVKPLTKPKISQILQKV